MNVVVSYRLLIPAVKNLRLMACLVTLLVCSPSIQAQTDTRPGTILPPPPEYRTVPDSTVRRLKNEKDFEYANDPAYWDLEQERERKRKREQDNGAYKRSIWDFFYTTFSGVAIRIVSYVLLGIFFLFVIYRIMVVNKLFLFYTSRKAKVTAGAGEAVDIENDNLDEKIRNAVQTGEHRQAIRLMYLKALQILNEKQWIKYHVDATNYEYVIQMSKHKLGDDFGFLTRIYDYVWYGEFKLTQEQFEIVSNNFSHFYNAANS
ncbi:DUF4129 domain-containing protein [Niastella yeongjuensis]|nr:DUF4129 domain-containing protein [Niastella yeongjuensis]